VSIVIAGTGYVGLVTGACLSEVGHGVICVDVDAARVARLADGDVPFYEPGLAPLVRNGIDSGRLSFTTSLTDAYRQCKTNRTLRAPVIMIAVGTPPREDGSADTSVVVKVAHEIGQTIDEYTVVASKSTVPVGTCDEIARAIEKSGAPREGFDVVSNPEFLKEGAAVDDFMRPSRIIVGSNAPAAADVMLELYRPFNMNRDRVIMMRPRDAELTKYAANAMLAAKISFMNEIANVCDRLEVDVDSVRRGIGSDPRIGHAFIYPGAGYGGSCFPKDVQALIYMAAAAGVEPRMLRATHERNEEQKKYVSDRVVAQFGTHLAGHIFAIWGLSFKPGTDDVREAPALQTARALLNAGATLRAFDPVASAQFSAALGPAPRFGAVNDKYEAVDGASALLLMTEWKEFRNPDFERLKRMMKTPCIIDGRNQFDPARLRAAGWTYHGVGRP
jgi:UDPglucose 6-dehydrogenase